MHKQAECDNFKFSRITRQNLATSYAILLGLFDDSLKSWLVEVLDFQNMVRSRGFCIMKSFHLTKKVCNGSSGMMVEDVAGNVVEATCNMLFVKGDDCPCLPKQLEVSNEKCEVLEGTFFGIGNIRFRDSYLSELESRG